MLRIMTFVGIFIASTSVAQARCTWPAWRFVWGVEGAIYLTTDGTACPIKFTYTNATTEVHSVAVTTRPQHGTATTAGHLVRYQPARGYKGEDTFVFTIIGRTHNGPQRAPMRVHVRVN